MPRGNSRSNPINLALGITLSSLGSRSINAF